jgi:large subunit ribosomal protein L30
MAQTLKIRQIRSTIGAPEKLRKVVRGLGLRKINHTVERPDNPSTWGMVRKVPHLVEVVK